LEISIASGDDSVVLTSPQDVPIQNPVTLHADLIDSVRLKRILVSPTMEVCLIANVVPNATLQPILNDNLSFQLELNYKNSL
jgi:hypothetical protein